MRAPFLLSATFGVLMACSLAFGQAKKTPPGSLSEDEVAVIQNIELLLNLEMLSNLELTENIDLLLIDLESEELIIVESEGAENE
jgi:hypothetical protein